ncbi:MAG: hypothetical protein ACQEXJ_23210 [Myxococcota bacterium]
MTRRPAIVVIAAAAALVGCRGGPAGPTGAFESPVDFAYACEGEGRTVAPDNVELAPALSSTRMCPDVTVPLSNGGTVDVQGYLFGVALSKGAPGVNVVQMNPAARGGSRVLDADPFIPGFSPIPVPRGPMRVLRASDWGSFYVVSAGQPSVTRIVLEGYQGDDRLEFATSRFDLPGQPSAATMRGDTLVVAAANRPEIWEFDLAADPDAPPRTTRAVAGPVRSMEPLGDDLLVTWVDRPVVSLLDGAGDLAEAGIRPACSDTLDNDGDGLVDAADPDCWGPADTSEDGPLGERPADDVEPPAAYEDGPSACEDGLDNDLDGLTDAEDPACAAGDGDAEWLPECADGLDNDGDGLTDTDDPGCYGPFDTVEGQVGPFGPYGATGVDAGDLGRFVYAVDPERGRVAVFDAADGLERVVAPEHDAGVPAAEFPAYRSDRDPVEVPPVVSGPKPGPAFQGEQDLVLPSPAGFVPSSSRVRGELWSRLLEPDEDIGRPAVPFGLSGSEQWLPPACSPDFSEACVQPEADDEAWYVFLPRLDGRVQLIEVIRRGQVFHHFAQSTNQPDERDTDITRPSLRLRGRSIPVGSSLPEGFPFLGPLFEEEIAERVEDESPAVFRRWGLWPPEEPERTPSETWFLTYEGVIPGTDSGLGRMMGEDTFYDPKGRFCELGVEPGDWLELEAAPESLAPDLRLEAEVRTEDGLLCPTEPADVAVVEVPVTAVGMTTLDVDPAGARLRPVEPVLDEDAVADDPQVTLANCRSALSDLQDVLGRPEFLEPTDAFAPENLPRRVLYSVRAAGAWIAVGSRSGYLHDNVWDAEAGACVPDEDAPERQKGRLTTARLADGVSYATCPPSLDLLGADSVDEALAGDHVRFENWSFGVDVFPGCEIGEDGGVERVPTQRDTRWTFFVQGPDTPSSVSAQGAFLGPRVPLLDFRRQQIQLDTVVGRIHHLQVRPGSTTLLGTFE